jgi:hypothetical protein
MGCHSYQKELAVPHTQFIVVIYFSKTFACQLLHLKLATLVEVCFLLLLIVCISPVASGTGYHVKHCIVDVH